MEDLVMKHNWSLSFKNKISVKFRVRFYSDSTLEVEGLNSTNFLWKIIESKNNSKK